jgi:CheY-like chemotaxis protein
MLKVYLVETIRWCRSTSATRWKRRRASAASATPAGSNRARSELPQCRPDVLLSDLGLPDGDGTELIGELSHAPAIDGVWHPHILVFSVFGDEARVIQAIEAGADGYFLKGCTADELIRAVEQAARGESPISPAIARHLLKRFRDDGYSDSGFREPSFGPDTAPAPLTGPMDLEAPVAQRHRGQRPRARGAAPGGPGLRQRGDRRAAAHHATPGRDPRAQRLPQAAAWAARTGRRPGELAATTGPDARVTPRPPDCVFRTLASLLLALLLVFAAAAAQRRASAVELREALLLENGRERPVMLPDSWEASAPQRRGTVRYRLCCPMSRCAGRPRRCSCRARQRLRAGAERPDPAERRRCPARRGRALALAAAAAAAGRRAARERQRARHRAVRRAVARAGPVDGVGGPMDELQPLYARLHDHQVRGAWLVAASATVMGALALLLAWRARRFVYACFGAASLLWAWRMSGMQVDGGPWTPLRDRAAARVLRLVRRADGALRAGRGGARHARGARRAERLGGGGTRAGGRPWWPSRRRWRARCCWSARCWWRSGCWRCCW